MRVRRAARRRPAEHRTQACSSGPRLTLVDAGQPAPAEGLTEPVALHIPRVHPPPRPIPNLPRELARRPRRHTRDEQRRSATHIGLDQAVSAGCGDQPLEVLLVLCATTSLASREECNPDGSDRQLTPTPLAMYMGAASACASLGRCGGKILREPGIWRGSTECTMCHTARSPRCSSPTGPPNRNCAGGRQRASCFVPSGSGPKEPGARGTQVGRSPALWKPLNSGLPGSLCGLPSRAVLRIRAIDPPSSCSAR